MQRLSKLFRRSHPVQVLPAARPEAIKSPVPLCVADLAKVAGGLPNVGGFSNSAPETAPVTTY